MTHIWIALYLIVAVIVAETLLVSGMRGSRASGSDLAKLCIEAVAFGWVWPATLLVVGIAWLLSWRHAEDR